MARFRQTEAVNDAVMAWIDDGTLLPGDQIDEKSLMDACNVSRTPVREALIQLEVDGLIVRHARKGACLFKPSTDEFLAILEVHANLEAHAAELAARRISSEQAKALAAIVEECLDFSQTSGAQSHFAYYELNMRFHEIIAAAACNPFLIDMIKLNARKLMAYYRMRYRTPGAIGASAKEHAEIAELITLHQDSAARQAMVDHFNYERETVMNMIASVGQSRA